MFSALGALGGAAVSYLGANSANAANARLARDQMAFQERMSNTSYQRAVADMKKAGINPMAAFSQGGASSPPGSTASNVNPLMDASNSAKSAFLDSRVAQSTIDLNRAAAAREISSARLNDENAAVARLAAAHSAAGLPKSLNQASVHNSWYGKLLSYLNASFK